MSMLHNLLLLLFRVLRRTSFDGRTHRRIRRFARFVHNAPYCASVDGHSGTDRQTYE